MAETNDDIWAEVIRTAELLRSLEATLHPMEEAAIGLRTIDSTLLPVDYVSDAMALTQLILILKKRDAKIV